jgi:hypothetical protein
MSGDISPSATPAARQISWRRTTAWIALATISGAANIAATTTISSAVASYRDGQHNMYPPFFFGSGDQICLAIWVVTGIVLLFLASNAPGATRHFARGILLVCIAALPFQCSNRVSPWERYETGFQEWTYYNIDPGTVRSWSNTLPAVAQETEIPRSSWPKNISTPSPTRIFQQPSGKGVVLQWGDVGAWGISRGVFVGANDDVAPPEVAGNARYEWKYIRPGLYAAYQDTD